MGCDPMTEESPLRIYSEQPLSDSSSSIESLQSES